MKNEIEFQIEGVCPLLMDNWIDGKQPKTDKEYREQAKNKVYKNEEGFLAIPTRAIKSAMVLASSEIGKKMDAKKNRQTIKSAVFFDKEFLSMGKKEYDDIVRHIVRRGQGTKTTAVPTYRPIVKEWKVSGKIITIVDNEQFLKEVLELAGLRYGLLAYRPEFGRFIITKWEVNGNEQQRALH